MANDYECEHVNCLCPPPAQQPEGGAEVLLLPCPFDGEAAATEGDWIFCGSCGVGFEGPRADKSWNRRPSIPPISPERAAVYRAVDEFIKADLDFPGAVGDALHRVNRLLRVANSAARKESADGRA